MKFKTRFMSDEEKRGQYFDLPLFFNIYKQFNQFLAPGGLSAECVQVSVMLTWDPQDLRSSAISKLVFSYVIVVNRNTLNFVGFGIIPKFEGL